ncbi:MAG: hypothetical protein R6W72_00265 [Desulfurivibrionaceae bacterium]
MSKSDFESKIEKFKADSGSLSFNEIAEIFEYFETSIKETSRQLSIAKQHNKESEIKALEAKNKEKEAVAKYETAKNLQQDIYKEVIKELFEEPQKSLEVSAKTESKRSIRWTLIVTLVTIVVSTFMNLFIQNLSDRTSKEYKVKLNQIAEEVKASTDMTLGELKREIIRSTQTTLKENDASLKILKSEVENSTEDSLIRLNVSTKKELGQIKREIIASTNLGLGEIHKSTKSAISELNIMTEKSLNQLQKDSEKHFDRIYLESYKSVQAIEKVSDIITSKEKSMVNAIRILNKYKNASGEYKSVNDLRSSYKVELVDEIGPIKYDHYIKIFKDFGVENKLIPRSSYEIYKWDKELFDLYTNWLASLENEKHKNTYLTEEERTWNTFKTKDDDTDYRWMLSSEELEYKMVIDLVATRREKVRDQMKLNGY